MKNVLIVLFAVAAIGLGAVCMKQVMHKKAAQEQLERTRVELEQNARKVAELKAAEERATQQHSQLVKLSEDLGTELKAKEEKARKEAEQAALKQQNAPGGEGESADKQNDFGKLVSNMMKDPEMKKVIQGQQRMMMDQLYDPFVKKMNLSSDEADKLKNLIADNMANATDKALSMFGDSTNRAEAIKALEADQKASDEQIKELLGDSRFSQYQEYQQTLGERTQLNMFKQSMSGDQSITDAQTDQLLALMAEEKKNVEANTGQHFPGNGADKASFDAILSQEQSDKLLEAQQAVNQRVLDRAGSVLQPDQLQAFARFQTNQMNMMRMGLGMARKLMGGSGSGGSGSN